MLNFIRIKFSYSNRIFLFEKNLSSTQKGHSTQKVVQNPKFLDVVG